MYDWLGELEPNLGRMHSAGWLLTKWSIDKLGALLLWEVLLATASGDFCVIGDIRG